MKKLFGLKLFAILFLLTGSLWAQEGKYLVLDGTDDSLKITPDLANFQFDFGITNEMTISFWAKGDKDKTAGTSTYILGAKAGTSFKLQAIMPNIADAVYVAAGFSDRTTTPFVAKEWHHWVFTRKFVGVNSPDNISRIYKDGVDVSNTLNPNDNTDRQLKIPSFAGISDLVFGTTDFASPNQWFKGRVDELRIWKKTLTAAEAAQVKDGASVQDADLLCNLKFEDSANPIKDEKSILTIQATGNPVIEDAPPTATANKAVFAPGEAITITFNNSGSAVKDWFAIFNAADGPNSVNFNKLKIWNYLNNSQTSPGTPVTSGTVTLNAPTSAGLYKIYYLNNDGYSFNPPNLVMNISVEEPPAPQAANSSLKCMELDGNGDYLEITGNKLKDIDGQVTVAFWAKLDATAGNNYAFFANTTAGGANGQSRIMSSHIVWDNLVAFDTRRTNGARDRVSKTDSSLKGGKWHHWAFVKNTATGVMTIYRDGDQFQTASSRPSPVKDIDFFDLGARKGNNPFKGKIDEFRLWNKALTATEVETIAKKTTETTTTIPNVQKANMLVYLSFEDATDPWKNSVANAGLTITPNGDPQVINNTAFQITSPAYGVEVTKVGNELKWTTDFEDGVVSYNVEKKVNGVWTTVTAVAASGEANANYSLLVGEGEFRITAVDGTGFSQTFATESTKQVFINLNEGWNLISVPFEGADLAALKAEGAIWVWDGKAYQKSDDVNALQGVWVFSTADQQVTLSGSKVADSTINLASGWNLVGPAENCKVPAGVTVFSWEDTYQQILENSAGLIQGHGYWMFADKKKSVKLGL